MTRSTGSSSDWRGLLALAQDCAADARSSDVAVLAGSARLTALRIKANAVSPALFEREAGAAAADAARAFLTVTRGFARRETPGELRTALAPMVTAGAAFLDDRLHDLATRAFERAHQGRPEVFG